jgi:hypothetical protein
MFVITENIMKRPVYKNHYRTMRTKTSGFFKVHVSFSRYLQDSAEEGGEETIVGPLPTQEKTKEILMFVP